MIAHDLDLLLDQALDLAKVRPLSRVTEGDRVPLYARSTSATDSVYVALWLIREIEVEDVAHAWHVDPARRDVGRDERGERPISKGGERSSSGILALVTVDRRC